MMMILLVHSTQYTLQNTTATKTSHPHPLSLSLSLSYLQIQQDQKVLSDWLKCRAKKSSSHPINLLELAACVDIRSVNKQDNQIKPWVYDLPMTNGRTM